MGAPENGLNHDENRETYARLPADHNFDGHADASADAAALRQLVLSIDTLHSFLDELAALAARSTGHHCGITVRGVNGSRDYTVASSGDFAVSLDERQYADGTGPCIEALTTATPVIVTDMATETRWGPYPSHAVALGARSSLSYPLISAEDAIGALNLYATEPVEPSSDLQSRVAALAGQVAGALALALRLAERDDLIATLRTALTSRSTIDQAMGILMAQQRCDPRTAFDLLRQASQHRNIKLRDVAAQIVGNVGRDSPGAPSGRY
jgi:GAF domain-containing protein